MVLTLILPLRAIYGLHDLVTQYHIDCMCKIILATGSMVGYAYAMEFFIAWYGANPYEGFAFINRAFGQYAWAYWIMISCNVITPAAVLVQESPGKHGLGLDHRPLRQRGHVVRAFCDHRHLPGQRLPAEQLGLLLPTMVDILTFFGTFGVFSVLFLLFIRFLPLIAFAEVKALSLPQADPHNHDHPENKKSKGAHG